MVDIRQLPIPDWGLACPSCRYPLRGLPEHRCPECGTRFDIRDLIRPWTRLRPPRLTGDELPLPDFGLTCEHCRAPLAGARERRCPVCGTPFDLSPRRPAGEWFVLEQFACRPLPIPGLEALLGAEQVPHIPMSESTVRELYTGGSPLPMRLRIAGEFYFEVLWLIQQVRREMAAARGRPAWRCPQCGEENPGNFDVCWNCAAAE